jgi:poly-gamma-glutamate synthesis protein (capsule biosynthesis protein)
MAAEFSLFLAGDAMLTVPWSAVTEPAFLDLVDEMRAADATILNLETVIHSYRGFAQAESGGTWTTSPPAIATELAWAGVDMVAHANNHAFDYGSEGVMETIEHVTGAGIVLSGSGADLQRARSPGGISRKGLRIAHVSMAATFVPYGRASRSRPDIPGRPGVNPLSVTREPHLAVPSWFARMLKAVDGLLGRDTQRYSQSEFRRFGARFRIAPQFSVERGKRPVKQDRDGNLEAVRAAAGDADITVVSIHSHNESPWLMRFVAEVVAAGASIVVVHGAHAVRGIALVEGKPVFLGLGDFAYQAAQIAALPAEAYERHGLGDEAGPADLLRAAGAGALNRRRETFEGAAAILRFDGTRLTAVELLPLDLGFDGNAPDRGRPQLADAGLGHRIVSRIAEMSKVHGTEVIHDRQANRGILRLAP